MDEAASCRVSPFVMDDGTCGGMTGRCNDFRPSSRHSHVARNQHPPSSSEPRALSLVPNWLKVMSPKSAQNNTSGASCAPRCTCCSLDHFIHSWRG